MSSMDMYRSAILHPWWFISFIPLKKLLHFTWRFPWTAEVNPKCADSQALLLWDGAAGTKAPDNLSRGSGLSQNTIKVWVTTSFSKNHAQSFWSNRPLPFCSVTLIFQQRLSWTNDKRYNWVPAEICILEDNGIYCQRSCPLKLQPLRGWSACQLLSESTALVEEARATSSLWEKQQQS